MPIMLFKMRGVDEDEVDDVRALLKENRIDFYETPPSFWGVSMEAIWLSDDSQLEQAKQLVEEYQIQRSARVREEYQEMEREGLNETLLSRFLKEPLRFLAYLLIILLVGYLSIKPFWALIG